MVSLCVLIKVSERLAIKTEEHPLQRPNLVLPGTNCAALSKVFNMPALQWHYKYVIKEYSHT